MVYASWSLQFQTYYNDTLAWLAAEYGPVNNYLYAIASTQYFGPEGNDGEHHTVPFNYSNATVAQAVQAFIDGADAMVVETVTFVDFAKALNVKMASYESGPGYLVGGNKPGSKALNTMIETSRAPGMFDVRSKTQCFMNIESCLVHVCMCLDGWGGCLIVCVVRTGCLP